MLKKYPILAFFVLSYTFSWIFWLPLVIINLEATSYTVLIIIIGGFGPLISSWLISKKLGYWDTLKRSMFKLKDSLKWYLSALLLPFALLLLSYGIFLALGGKPEFSELMPPFYIYPLLLLFVMVLGGGLEEPGWRGFALPMLLKKYTLFSASILIGLLWGLWHLPLFFIPGSSQFNLPLHLYIPNAFALSIIFSWLYIKSKKNIWLAIILHGGINAAYTFYPGMNSIETSFGTLSFYVPITLSTSIIAILLTICYRKIFFVKH